MTLREYISSLDTDAAAAFAARCKISINYLRLHVKYASKDPSVGLMRALARESDGNVRLEDVLVHFGLVPHPEAA